MLRVSQGTLPKEEMNSLKEIETTLRAALSSDSMFGLVNTRLTLKTGVDLNVIKPADDRSVEKIARVVEALDALGYSAAALQVIARKRGAR